jgi:hypothetical protein
MASQALDLAAPAGFALEKRLSIHSAKDLPAVAALVRAVPCSRGYRCEFATALTRSGYRPQAECREAGARDPRAGGPHTFAAQIPKSEAPNSTGWWCPNTIVPADRRGYG